VAATGGSRMCMGRSSKNSSRELQACLGPP
jgi:hypothetical protein